MSQNQNPSKIEPRDSPCGRAKGSEKTRKMLTALLGSVGLTSEAEHSLLTLAGENDIRFSDDEIWGIANANPDVGNFEEEDSPNIKGTAAEIGVPVFSAVDRSDVIILDDGTHIGPAFYKEGSINCPCGHYKQKNHTDQTGVSNDHIRCEGSLPNI